MAHALLVISPKSCADHARCLSRVEERAHDSKNGRYAEVLHVLPRAVFVTVI